MHTFPLIANGHYLPCLPFKRKKTYSSSTHRGHSTLTVGTLTGLVSLFKGENLPQKSSFCAHSFAFIFDTGFSTTIALKCNLKKLRQSSCHSPRTYTQHEFQFHLSVWEYLSRILNWEDGALTGITINQA